MTEEQREEEILRLLNNTREEYHHCSFHSRGFGMDYFASAESLMRESSLPDLSRYMDVVEEVRQFGSLHLSSSTIVRFIASPSLSFLLRNRATAWGM